MLWLWPVASVVRVAQEGATQVTMLPEAAQ